VRLRRIIADGIRPRQIMREVAIAHTM